MLSSITRCLQGVSVLRNSLAPQLVKPAPLATYTGHKHTRLHKTSAAFATMPPADPNAVHPAAKRILEYWFGTGILEAPVTYQAPQENVKMWFGGGPAVDEEIKTQFSADIEAVAAGKYDPWMEQPYNAMAAIILMDQFTRNVYRGSPQAFSLDTKAITWARHLLATGRCNAVPFSMRFFLLLPFMHQEDLATQEEGVVLFTVEVERAKAVEGAEGHVSSLENGRKFMAAHRDVIKQWGRFPHRNATLGRQSTPDEDQGLKDGSIAKF